MLERLRGETDPVAEFFGNLYHLNAEEEPDPTSKLATARTDASQFGGAGSCM